MLDFGRRTLWDDGSGYEPLVIVEPTFRENLNYFFTYQLNHMYWRYFLWNFVGRQSDIQPTDAIITTATGSRASSGSTSFTSGRRTTCRTK